MVEFLVELLLGVLGDALFQFGTELLLEFGWETIAHSLRRGRSANPILAGVGLLLIGAVVGLVTCWLLPHPLFQPVQYFPRLSLVLAPIATGAAIHAFGVW